MELHVSFRGKQLAIAGVEDDTIVADLKEKLEGITGVPVTNQKLILKGKALRDDSASLQDAGVLVVGSPSTTTTPASAPASSIREKHEEGDGDGSGEFVQKAKLLLVGSTPAEVEEILPRGVDRVTTRNDLDGTRVPKGYKKVALNHPPGPSEFSPYRFERIETLPGLPEEETAREILESLAADPGVRSVLEKHKWTVGALCELYPKGKVGVSDKCIMGLNQNYGMKILLRLRTDDLRGFRKILSIRKVLFHELAHNEIGPHNDEFYKLMRQVEREAAELDWRQQSGRTIAGRSPGPRAEPAGVPGGGEGFVLVKEAFEGGSGRLGGESGALANIFSPRVMAGQAAVMRLSPEEQEVEDCCGHTKGNEGAGPDDAAAATAVADPRDAMGACLSCSPQATASTPQGVADAVTAAVDTTLGAEERPAETVLPLISKMSVTSDDMVDDGEAVATALSATAAAAAAAAAAAEEEEGGGTRGSGGSSGDDGARQDRDRGGGEENNPTTTTTTTMTTTTRELMDVAGEGGASPPSSPATLTPNTAAPRQQTRSPSRAAETTPTASQPYRIPAPVDELVAMGFPREAATEALAASDGSIPDAAYRLLTPGMMSSTGTDGSSAASAAAVAVADDGAGRNDHVVVGGNGGGLPRDVRLQQAANRIGGHEDRLRALQCLDVLAAVFRNIMEHPEEPRFRKMRRSNGKFKAAVSDIAGGVDLLLAAGFEVRGTDQLELGREDPGLIWLARSMVESWQQRLSPVA